ncbi:MAG: ABC transporter permease subunit [Armatimonadetes bacterium]|nr:ABC transporter permease subunit [Armatimonadota bacterium]
MSLLADNPVFRREARWWLRLRRLRKNKALAWPVGVMLLCLACFYWRGLMAFFHGADVNDARTGWIVSLFVVLGVIVLLAPTLSANAISQEREQQTWETLAATRLTAGQVLAGKWLARLVPVGLFILLALPPLLGCGFIGGISWLEALAVLAFLLATAAFFSLVGLTCSFLARKTMTAITLSVTVAMLLCLGTYIMDLLIGGMIGDPWYNDGDLLVWGNPFYVLAILLQWLDPTGSPVPPQASTVVGTYSGMLLLAIVICFYYMLTRYRRAVRGGRPLGEPLK